MVKAQTAEQKAEDAPDGPSRCRALREAAHQWDRAAERELPGKRRAEYQGHASRTRDLAEGGSGDSEAAVDAKLMN